ncbi:MAG: tetratricopeptide repeat protein, partial [Sandaracinaceae bacterium]
MERGDEAAARRLWLRALGRPGGLAAAAARLLRLLPADPARAAEPSPPERRLARRVLRALERAQGTSDPAPVDADLLRARAWCRAIGGDHQRAVAELLGALRPQDRAQAALLRRLAAVALHRGDPESARTALDGAHRARPQDPQILVDRAALDLRGGEPERAIGLLERALLRRPGDLGIRRDLAGALLAAGRGDEAMAVYRRAGQEAAPNDEARLELGIELAHAALQAGRPGPAAAAARRAAARA